MPRRLRTILKMVVVYEQQSPHSWPTSTLESTVLGLDLGLRSPGHVPGSVRAVGRQDCANLKLASQMLKLGDHLGQPVPEQRQCPPRVSLRFLRLRD